MMELPPVELADYAERFARAPLGLKRNAAHSDLIDWCKRHGMDRPTEQYLLAIRDAFDRVYPERLEMLRQGGFYYGDLVVLYTFSPTAGPPAMRTTNE